MHASTCKGRLPHLDANFLTLLRSDRSSSQTSINSLLLINSLALSPFSSDLQAIMMFHSLVVDRALTAAKPIPLFAPVTITVLLFAAIGVAAETSGNKQVASISSKQQKNIVLIIIATGHVLSTDASVDCDWS